MMGMGVPQYRCLETSQSRKLTKNWDKIVINNNNSNTYIIIIVIIIIIIIIV